jgi:iron complex outermembrane recepter protein
MACLRSGRRAWVFIHTSKLKMLFSGVYPLRSARCWACLWLLCGSAAQAQVLDWDLRRVPLSRFLETSTLEALVDTVVTDTKTAQPSNTVTQKIEVLHNDEFDLIPGVKRNLADLVSYNSGQFVNVLFRTNGNWGSFGGLGPKYNSYLLDGVPIDNFVEAMTIEPSAIASVELHKGPASVLYSNYLSMDFAGNQSPMAGTTNFVLKKEVEHTLTKVQAGLGTWNTRNGQLYHQGRQGDLSYIALVAVEGSDYTRRYQARPQMLDSPDYRRQQVFGSLNYRFAEPGHALSVFGQVTSLKGDEGRPNKDFAHSYTVLNAAYSAPLGEGLTLGLKAGLRQSSRGFDNDLYPASLALDRFERTRQTIVPLELGVQLVQGKHLLTAGLDHQRADYEVSNRAPSGATQLTNSAQATSTGLFVQDKVQWGRWIVRGGLRFNQVSHHYDALGGVVPTVRDKHWDKTLWSLGGRYNASPSLAFYANAGSSFMLPSAKQIGGTVPAASPNASGEVANPGLRPESGQGVDAGMDWAPMPDLKLSARIFSTRISDAIITSALNPDQSYSLNEAKVQSQGGELDVRYAPHERLSLFFNLTGISSRLADARLPATDGSAMPFSPDWMAQAGLNTRVGEAVRVSTYVRWVGRYYDSIDRSQRAELGQNTQLNLRFDYLWQPHVQFFADLMNLTDAHDLKPFGMAEPGRNVFVGMVAGF